MASKKIPKSRIIQHFLSLPEEQRVRLLNKHLSPESIKSLGANEFYTPMIGLRDKPEEEARRFLKDHFGDSPEHLKKTVKHGEVLAENFKDSIYSNFGGKTDEDKLYALVKSQTMSNRLRIFYEDLSDKAKKSYNNAALASLNKKNVLSYYLDDPRNFAEGKSPDDFLEDVMKTMDLSKEKSMMEHIRTGAPAEDPDRKEKIQLAAQMCMILPESRFDPEAFTGELQDKGTSFSEKAKRELALMEDALDEIMGYANLAFTGDDWTEARHIEPIEEVIDDMVETLRANHLRRLREGRCNVDAGFIFLDILVNVERIADQCSNIGIYTISLHDAQAAEMQHDYIRHLHQGENEQFNQEFAAAHAMYFDRLKAIEFGTGD